MRGQTSLSGMVGEDNPTVHLRLDFSFRPLRNICGAGFRQARLEVLTNEQRPSGRE